MDGYGRTLSRFGTAAGGRVLASGRIGGVMAGWLKRAYICGENGDTGDELGTGTDARVRRNDDESESEGEGVGSGR